MVCQLTGIYLRVLLCKFGLRFHPGLSLVFYLLSQNNLTSSYSAVAKLFFSAIWRRMRIGSFVFLQPWTSSLFLYVTPGSDMECPWQRQQMSSIKSGPFQIAHFFAHLKAQRTSKTLLPSILKPGMTSPLLQNSMFIEERTTDVPMPQLLFSQMNKAGRFHILAMLAASNSCPWLAAPSPNITEATFCLFQLYFRAKANPAPTGTWAPTIPFPPQKFISFLQKCIDPPRP